MNKALYCNSLLFILCCASLKAQESVDTLPSIAFLEYLADMEEVDGKLYGPQDMHVESCKKLASAQVKQSNETRDEINGVQNDKPPKNEDTAIKQECNDHV